MPNKILVVCQRKDGITDEQLRTMQAEHAQLVKAFTDGIVLRYEYGFAHPNPDGSAPMADLVVEVTVTSFEEYFAAIETPGGQEAVAHADTYLGDVQFVLLDAQEPVWG